jgi:hypothetical protein
VEHGATKKDNHHALTQPSSGHDFPMAYSVVINNKGRKFQTAKYGKATGEIVGRERNPLQQEINYILV